MALGLLAGAAKMGVGKLTKPKPKAKINPKKFAGQMEDTKAESKGGALVPAPTLSIVKVVDVKVDQQSKKTDKGGPLVEIRETTNDILLWLRRDNKAKKKKAQKKAKIEEKKRRSFLESLREISKVGGAVGGKMAAAAGVSNLFNDILNALGILFLGWSLKYLPQILKWVKGLLDNVKKLIEFAKPIVTPIIDILKWIGKTGVTLVASLAVGWDEASENSVIKNLTEIQKRFKLIEAAFAAFLVFKTLKVTKIRQPRPRGPSRTPSRTPGSGGRPSPSNRIPSNRASSIQTRHGHSARKIYENAIRNGKTPRAATAAVNRALSSGRIVSTPQAGRLAGGIRGSNVFKGGIKKAGKRLTTKIIGKAGLKMASKMFSRIPIVGSLIVAITQLLAGEPVGKALFMGFGAGIGGLLGSFIPIPIVGTLIGEAIGLFVGDLLYTGMFGEGWGAAGKKLKETLLNILSMGKAAIDWIGGGVVRYGENFLKETAMPVKEGWGVRDLLTKATKKLGLYDWLKKIGYAGGAGGRIDKFPNLLQLFNPFKYGPILLKSFFPPGDPKPQGSSSSLASQSVGGPQDEMTGGVSALQEGRDQSDAVSGVGAGGKQQDASSISGSASYDQAGGPAGVGGFLSVPIGAMGGAGGSGGAGGGSLVNRYDAAEGLLETIKLRQMYPG